MKNVYVLIFLILFSIVNGNNFDILEDNGVLFFKYSKNNLINEVENFLEKYKELLDKDFEFVGEKKYVEETKIEKNQAIYYICKLENNIEKCLFYINGKKRNYSEKDISSKKTKMTLTYDENGKTPRYLCSAIVK
ncbi:hypothetical protein [Sebaldella sp. S0638]|uniref:hypothetical protein n=1 Tax=Sebaldella sp. S0638 TaxID=2957809 RepID=UPI00209F46AC|nr:hypothetical protein [Sebaldella sp. S0638]MCP1226524.1 hypothetical protein [Sebaldella sp. S0638]